MEQKTMQAAVLHAVADLRCETVAIPACQKDEVLVQIMDCGICGSDIGRVLKKGTYHFPTIPGHEFAGRVVEDPSGEFFGKRVAVFPLLPCFECESCKEQRYAQCADYDYYGSRRDGAFAEYLAVKRFNLVELPDGVSYEEGAMSEPMAVALHAVKKLNLKGGEHLLVTGAGTIGLMAGMWAKSFGAEKVCYIDLDTRKLDFAREKGFAVYEAGEQIDCVLEGTGASGAIATGIKAVKPAGTVVLMGNPGGDVGLSAADYQLILRKELVLCGTWNSLYAQHENDWRESIAAIAEGRMAIRDLITHRVPISECRAAIEEMAAGEKFYCKVMVTNEK